MLGKHRLMPLREYQQQAVDSIFTYLRTHQTGNPIVAQPTGTGKSHVIAAFIQTVMYQAPAARFLVLTHRKELVSQDAAKIKEAWPTAPLGVYSAGLRRRDTTAQIIVGGIASVARNLDAFGHRDVVIIDECHLISDNAESMYGKTIDHVCRANPRARVIGLSATPYRLGQGRLIDGELFSDVCCDQTTIEWFSYFIAHNYLAPVIPKRPDVEADVAHVAKRGGDYAPGQLQRAVDVETLTHGAVNAMLQQAQQRKRWLVFASGVQHAKNIAEYMQERGIAAYPVYGALPTGDREKLLEWFTAPSDDVRCLVNNNVLTTGFDHPPIDLIGMLRPTTSPALWVQMIGRGMRPAANKRDCLVLDFAGNTRRLGPVNDPVMPKRRGHGGDGAPPVKICPECDCYNHTTARECYFCGYVFPVQPKLTDDPSQLALLATTQIEDISIERVMKSPHHKKGKPPSLRVTYCRGLQQFREWICFEHGGSARALAAQWWARRSATSCPATVAEAINRWHELTHPRQVRVLTGAKYPRILDHLF